jgi:hypothetical protein
MNTHKLAIGIIREVALGKREAWDVLCLVAEHEPDSLCRAIGVSIPSGFARAGSGTHAKWVDDVIAVMPLNRVEAIKIIRTNRGLGLKEAKDVFDKAMEQQRMGMDASLIRETIAAWNAPNPNDIPF